MATVHLSPIGNGFQFLGRGGQPLLNGTLYTYQTNSATPAATYTTSIGNVQNSNPITLLSDGRLANEVWLIEGVSYRFQLYDMLGNLIQTLDDIYGINDLTVNSSGLPFIQAGTGAVTRTMQNKAREQFSVKDFGATGDGSTDDISFILAARSALLAAGGGTLLFPRGTYRTSGTIAPATGCTFRGEGPGNTIIKPLASNLDNVFGTGVAESHAVNWCLRDMEIDGNRANVPYNTANAGATDDTFQNGVSLTVVNQSTFKNLYIHDTVMNGIVMLGSVASGSSDNYFENIVLKDIGKTTNIVSGAASYNGVIYALNCCRNKFIGVYMNTLRGSGVMDTTNGTACTDNEFIAPIIISPTADGFNITNSVGAVTSARLKIINPTITGATTTNACGIRVDGAGATTTKDVTIVSPIIDNCYNGIAAITAERVSITAPNVRNCSNFGILVGANCIDIQIAGGYALSNSNNYTDGGSTRPVTFGLITDTTGKLSTPNSVLVTGSSVTISKASGNDTSFVLDQAGIETAYYKQYATSGNLGIGNSSVGDIIAMTVGGDATLGLNGKKVAFYGGGPVIKQTVTGAKAGNAALTSLMTALAAIGLVIDTTT